MKRSSIYQIWLSVVGLVIIFAVVTYFADIHQSVLRDFVEGQPVAGAFIYIVLDMFDAVIAPGSTLALVPVAGRLWGPWIGATLTVIGWTWGSWVAFFLADTFGQPLVRRLISNEKLETVRHYIPKNLFTGVILTRLVLPLDAISYALGLFTKMDYGSYIIATALGVAPSAFLLAFLGTFPAFYEVIIYSAGVAVFVWFVRATGQAASLS